MARTSSSPSGLPCACSVSVHLGDGQPMWLRSDDQRRLVLDVLGAAQRGLELLRVVGRLAQLLHVPPVGAEALGHVVAVGELGGPVDRDVVVVVHVDEAAEAEVAGERRGLVADALLQVAVAADDERVVVTHLGAEAGAQPALGDAHADGVGEALGPAGRW